MDNKEVGLLERLEQSIRTSALQRRFDEAIVRLDQALAERPDDIMAWETVSLDSFAPALPAEIRSAWIFTLRAGVSTGAERHPNSHQRSMSYRGAGEVQTRSDGEWRHFPLSSDPSTTLEERWASIPVGVWHQWSVGDENQTVLSFHTVAEDDLIEERPAEDSEAGVRQMKYADRAD